MPLPEVTERNLSDYLWREADLVLLGTEILSLSQLPGTFCSLRMPLSSQNLTSSRCMEKMPRTNRTVIVCVEVCMCVYVCVHTHTHDLHKWKTNTYKHFSISSQLLCEGEHFCYLHLIIITIIYNNNNYCCCCHLQRKKYAREYIQLENGKSQDSNLGCLTTNPSWSLQCRVVVKFLLPYWPIACFPALLLRGVKPRTGVARVGGACPSGYPCNGLCDLLSGKLSRDVAPSRKEEACSASSAVSHGSQHQGGPSK